MDLNDPNVRIQYLIKTQVDFAGKPVEFQDAIYFTADEFATLKADEVKAKCDARVAKWVDDVKNPKLAPELQKDEVSQPEG